MIPPRVAAVIVTFNPDPEVVARTVALLRVQVETVYIVDNGSQEETAEKLRRLEHAGHVEVMLCRENRGIAAALNRGIEQARHRGLDCLLLLDHDSRPAGDLIARLTAARQELMSGGRRLAAVGAAWLDERSGRQGLFYRIERGRIVSVALRNTRTLEVDFLISSGTMLELTSVESIGMMREDFFIDHVDTEWCLRARLAGFSLFGAPAAQIAHELGDSVQRVWLGRWREVAMHSPERNYYEVRNTVLLLRTPGIGWNWRLAHCTRLVQVLVFYSVFAPSRWPRLMRMAQGIRDGLAGRGGAISQGRVRRSNVA